MSARQGRHVVVPLIGVELDLDPVAIGLGTAAIALAVTIAIGVIWIAFVIGETSNQHD